jgi:hypothetical protein
MFMPEFWHPATTKGQQMNQVHLARHGLRKRRQPAS